MATFLAALRLTLAVLGIAEMSSVMHLVSDVHEMVATGVVPAHSDDNDDDGDECPVGCPNCHTSHGAASLPAGNVPLAVVALSPQARTGHSSSYEGRVVSRPRASIERPPRRTV